MSQPNVAGYCIVLLSDGSNQATDTEKKICKVMRRDDNFNFRVAHWADLHGLLYKSLPSDVILWGHHFLSFCISNNKASVRVKVKVSQTNEIKEIVGDLLLQNRRINWIWYVNQPEPELKGNSMTMKVSNEMIGKMVMKETNEPFINLIYDSDPLKEMYWDNVVLIGDAAHPTSPHGLRSTNMSILDAAVLGKCLEKWGLENLSVALNEFQTIRLPVISKQVLHSRRMGWIKHGLDLPDCEILDPMKASSEDCQERQQRNMPFFADAPTEVNLT
ncbi:hypothetical protein MKX01_002155 [Papaver californicum]|nr:hypothetical protein MKX01_002155 [Papaver californicum]